MPTSFSENSPRKTKAEFRFTTAALITIEEVVELAAAATEQRTAVLRHLERYRATGYSSDFSTRLFLHPM